MKGVNSLDIGQMLAGRTKAHDVEISADQLVAELQHLGHDFKVDMVCRYNPEKTAKYPHANASDVAAFIADGCRDGTSSHIRHIEYARKKDSYHLFVAQITAGGRYGGLQVVGPKWTAEISYALAGK